MYLFPRSDGNWWYERFNTRKDSFVESTGLPVGIFTFQAVEFLLRNGGAFPEGTFFDYRNSEVEWLEAGNPNHTPKGYGPLSLERKEVWSNTQTRGKVSVSQFCMDSMWYPLQDCAGSRVLLSQEGFSTPELAWAFVKENR